MEDPTQEQMERRKKERDDIKARRTQFQCRAHLKGRCINGGSCQHPHSTDPAEIVCNSMVTAADRGLSINNKTYGYCHLFYAKQECPYKDCVHSLSLASPEHEQVGSEGEAEDMSLL